MTYVNQRLFEGEDVVYEGRFHWFHHAQAWLVLIFLGIFLIGIFMFISMMIKFSTTEFVVTSRRVIFKKGWLSIKMEELQLDSIEGGNISQSFAGRIFGFGDVHVTGRGDTDIDFPLMDKPSRFLAAVEKARSELGHEHIDEHATQMHEDMERLMDSEEGFESEQGPGGTD
jgi:uncharacterized membrane protein YdbT with pleckstrin-like domain